MAKALVLVHLALPDPRRPTRMPSLPEWVISRVDALVVNTQIDPATKRFADVVTLPKTDMLTAGERAVLQEHLSNLSSYLRQTPEEGAEWEERTLCIITKMLLALPAQK